MSTTTAALAPAPESTTMQVQLLSENAKAPTKGSAFAAGHDLYSSADTVIPARKWALVPTDIKISVPAGTCTSPFADWSPTVSLLSFLVTPYSFFPPAANLLPLFAFQSSSLNHPFLIHCQTQ